MVQVMQQIHWGRFEFFHPWQGCNKEEVHFHCREASLKLEGEPVMFMSELWLACHRPPHILKCFYFDSLVTQ